jgi:hypothetical protein
MPSTPLKDDRYFGGACRLHLQDRGKSQAVNWSNWEADSIPFIANFMQLHLFLCVLYSYTLKIEAVSSLEASLESERITRRYVQEDRKSP